MENEVSKELREMAKTQKKEKEILKAIKLQVEALNYVVVDQLVKNSLNSIHILLNVLEQDK